MANRNREGIGRVMFTGLEGLAGGRHEHAYHLAYLVFIGRTGAHKRLFHAARGIFGDGQALRGEGDDERTTRLAKLQSTCTIGGDEGFLDCCRGGFVERDDAREVGIEFVQTLAKLGFAVGCNCAAIDEGEGRAFRFNNAPAGGYKARVDADDTGAAHSQLISTADFVVVPVLECSCSAATLRFCGRILLELVAYK